VVGPVFRWVWERADFLVEFRHAQIAGEGTSADRLGGPLRTPTEVQFLVGDRVLQADHEVPGSLKIIQRLPARLAAS
jgi:hypothetical protein